jgi:hypothetical protein
MSAPNRMGNGPLKSAVMYPQGFDVGDLKNFGEVGKADWLLVLTCEAKVTNTSGAPITALTLEQQGAFLESHTLDLRWDGNKQQQVTTEDGDNPLHSYQGTPFTKLNRVGKRLVEKALDGLGNTTTGLQQAIAEGVNTWKYTAYVSLGRVEFLKDDSIALWGVGPDMWRLCQLKVKTVSDYLKTTVDAGLTLTELAITYSTMRMKARGSRISLPCELRRYTPAAPKQDVETTNGVVMDAVDTAEPLASTDLGALTVTIGDDLVLSPPQTPADVDLAYAYAPDVNANVEGTIKAEATPIVVYPNTRLARIPGGKVRAVQETYNQQWQLEATIKPALTARQLLTYLNRLAQESLQAGETAHFVNTAPLEGIDLPSAMLSAGGVTMFRTTDPEASTYPGLRIAKGGGVELFTPPEHLDGAAREYRAAQEDKTRNPAGNAAGMDAAVQGFAKWVPGTVDDEVKGFYSTANNQGGPETALYRQCWDQVAQRAATVR